jgi:hypothetical protein
VLTESDLETNVLEFRQRSFSFDRLVTFDEVEYAVFSRTETESESQFRPRLVHLQVVVPLNWVVLDPADDSLRVARDGATAPPHLIETVVEVGAEPPQFMEQGIAWTRSSGPGGAHLYVPTDRVDRLCSAEGRTALGV